MAHSYTASSRALCSGSFVGPVRGTTNPGAFGEIFPCLELRSMDL